ncbi:MAG: 4-(cytidine 5'-diphospho)-2-C-methyl-D-erythritol kinase [Asticcacaulis sp.]|uniref:4-(cytidine 5'-diphospho)-2-C-methyl-D-erythritol kinase n=1 Tax=Asticcacaulis sp. TaxID=1872648 RepID=UPI0039E2872B
MLAPAKINLYLHVAAPDSRGYHPLQSLVTFADIGDEVTLLPAEAKLPLLSITGPFAGGLEAGEGNLIVKAVRRFEAWTGIAIDKHRIELVKNLPLASGIGGGSADAGATLRSLRESYAPDMSDDDLATIAGQTGADGVMCLWSRPAFAEGYGERITPVSLPPVNAIMINPGVECPTAQVYGGFDALGHVHEIDAAAEFEGVNDIHALIAALSHTRNDLQAPAIALQTAIADVLTLLEAQDETLFARMSGSGATCFALCETAEAAEALGVRMQAMLPGAWVRNCRLGG